MLVYNQLETSPRCVDYPNGFLQWRHFQDGSQAYLKGKLNCCPPPHWPRPLVVCSSTGHALPHGAARWQGRAPLGRFVEIRGLPQHRGRHALQIIRDFSVAIILTPFAYWN